MPRKRRPIEDTWPLDLGDIRVNPEFFHSAYRVDPASGCWLWFRGRHRQGYGMVGAYSVVQNTKIMMTAHRQSWRLHRGETHGLNIIKTCCVANCVNPEHMRLGTQQETITKPGAGTGGRPRGVPRPDLRGRPPRGPWARHEYQFTPDQIQYLRTHRPREIEQHLGISRKAAYAARQRARTGYVWLPWPEGTEAIQPRRRGPYKKRANRQLTDQSN